MSKELKPRIVMFNPFNEPFSENNNDDKKFVISKFVIVDPEVVGYMKDNNTKIVAKCTPCQCCACR